MGQKRWPVARDGITVNALLPGPFATYRLRSVAARQNIPVEKVAQRAARAVPVGRIVTPAEIKQLSDGGAAYSFEAIGNKQVLEEREATPAPSRLSAAPVAGLPTWCRPHP